VENPFLSADFSSFNSLGKKMPNLSGLDARYSKG